MQKYVKYYRLIEGDYVEALASDSIFHVDGRWSQPTIISKARKQAHRLRAVQPDFKAFKIMRGPDEAPYSKGVALSELIII